jgi:uncharacterized protein YciI
MTEVPAVRREIQVKASVDSAFALFTAHIAAWWPTDEHSIYGESGLVAFEGDRLVERAGDGMSVWADVVEWDPPHSLRLAWYPGLDAERATDLRVSFHPVADQTLVTVEHTGWERLEDPAGTAENYDSGWPKVLARFGDRVSDYAPRTFDAHGSHRPPDAGAASDKRDTSAAKHGEGEVQWYALVHTPGPLLGEGESLFAHPMFAEHMAFLGRLQERGLLVAAGPVVPERGEGMTIVKIDPAHSGVDIEQLATEDDRSVATGLLTVEVRPWYVRLSV